MTNQPLKPNPAPNPGTYCYRFGTAEFNEARFELKVAGLVVETERRALEVLAYLLRHAGEVVTKDELLREVWAGRITVDKVLPNAVNKLRKALGEANAQLISTQARLGYRLDGTVQRTAVGQPLKSEFALKKGDAVPFRSNFLLQSLLSKRTGGEVWLAEHRSTHERRVYKFADDGTRLRALKREATLNRVLQESLDEQSGAMAGFVEIIDWNFEAAPFFLECQFGGQNLSDWADQQLAGLDIEQRILLFLNIADAVALAHSVGVLHKDLKPANVVIMPREPNAGMPNLSAHWQVRLTDFGSGRLLNPERLEQLGISKLGMTVTQNIAVDDSSGTPLYLAPEVFAGITPTIQSDVYALGVIFYQLLSGRLHQPMAPGWEQDISDPILRADIQAATNGQPARRLGSVQELTHRLRSREARSQAAMMQTSQAEQAQRAQHALALTQARRPYLVAFVSALLLSVAGLFYLQQTAARARDQAQTALAQATALNRFIQEDLIGRSNPLLLANGQSTQIKDLLLAARPRIAERYQKQPLTQAALRASLAQLFLSIDLLPEAESEARAALALYRQNAVQGDAVLAMQSALVRALARQSKFELAKAELLALDQAAAGLPKLRADLASAGAWASYHIARAEFELAVPKLRAAIGASETLDADNPVPRDWLRLDLISALTAMDESKKAQAVGTQVVLEAKLRGSSGPLLAALAKAAMARSYSYTGDAKQAEALLLAAKPVIDAQLGRNHARSLTIVTELMSVAFRSYDYPKALIYAEQAHQTIRESRGDDHIGTWVTMGNWGRPYYELANYSQAKAKLAQAHQNLQRLTGPLSANTQDVAFLLVLTEIALGELDSAQARLQLLDAKVLESFRGHGMWQAGLDGARGLILLAQGDRTAALPLLETAEKAMRPETTDDPGDRLYLNVREALAGLRGDSNSKY